MIEHDDALNWLQKQTKESAKLVVFDPPYAVGTPVRGREDGAAGSVFGPFAFMHQAFTECARILKPGGVVMVFADWRRMFDLGYLASISGLRPTTCVAWVRNRPGTGGLFRSSWDPVLIVSRGVPDAIDRAAIRNVVVADYQTKRKHPYGKPVEVFEHVMRRICKPGDLVVDPFAGSGMSRTAAKRLKLRWAGCDIDPQYAESASDESPTTDGG
jgi:site-specific DNA-methyltransferase (adenine-specific)